MEDWNVNITRALLEECEATGAPSKKAKKKGKAGSAGKTRRAGGQGAHVGGQDGDDVAAGDDGEDDDIGRDGTAADRLSRKGTTTCVYHMKLLAKTVPTVLLKYAISPRLFRYY